MQVLSLEIERVIPETRNAVLNMAEQLPENCFNKMILIRKL